MKPFSIRLYQFIFLVKMLINTIAQDDEQGLFLPAASGTNHTRNIESQEFHQASSFKQERTTTQYKYKASPP